MIEAYRVHSHILLRSSRIHDHLCNSFLDVDDAEPVGLGSLWHDDHGHILVLTEATVLRTQLTNIEIHLGTATTVDYFWELDANGVGQCFENAERSQSRLSISLCLYYDYLGENGTVVQQQVEPVDKACLIANEKVAVELLNDQLILLPLCEVEPIILSMILLLDIVERGHIQQKLRNHLVTESLEHPDQNWDHTQELRYVQRQPHPYCQCDAR